MSAVTASIVGKDGRADALVASYARAGYDRVEPAVLQPAEPFLALSGEDIRRRMYLVADAGGDDLCLRPDLTIPVALDYLASPQAGRPARYSYLGPVFRQRPGASGEFWQAGIESFGRTDKTAADAEAVALALEATDLYGLAAPDIRMGDVGLFAALIEALDLAPVWRRRLAKDFNRKTVLAEDLHRLAVNGGNGPPEYQGVLAALANSDPKGARALVADLLSIAGISTVGGRSVAEIAARFLEQAELGAGAALPAETGALIERFFAVSGAPATAAAALRAFAADAGLDLAAALDLFEARNALLAEKGIDTGRIRFATAFGRGLDYYTGVVFELHDPQNRIDGQLVAGGRYDGLFARLGRAEQAGQPEPIPAVGFAVWIERLVGLGERTGAAQ
ncbi:ATP phosphoribosyltransferase regulatory subunit [Rhodoplanes roseus]|uniref:ATP phosphoribosyltransferase regulatory subunit n=1 Tax=Rhodoplanes roseus TaxID=29409 RepID=A0A327KWK5_9BRAD|nr:ATP phosphoribosyltransferase regulatory subunit [Rhodoplanes roseus]RAI42476.1 ATP phosphoribosyltransferase regulatory subunit [Rhodoplanes roseus]